MTTITSSKQLLKIIKNAFETEDFLTAETHNAIDYEQLSLMPLTKCVDGLYEIIAHDKLFYFFLKHYDLERFDASKLNPQKLLSLNMPYQHLSKQQWIPLACDKKTLSLGIANPGLINLTHELSIQLNMTIKCILIAPDICQRLHHEMLSLLIYQQYLPHKPKTTQQQRLPKHPDMNLLIKQIISDANFQNASDIHIEPMTTKIRVRMRKQGILKVVTNIDISFTAQLINFIKISAGLDISQQQLPQDGRLQFALSKDNKIDCRISTCPFQNASTQHEKCVIRILRIEKKILLLKNLGMSDAMQKIFINKIHAAQGLILVTGPTGSGKTNTLYTALSILNNSTRNIATIEDPIEIPLPGINQTAIQNKIGRDFARVLRAFLRQDPDILMIGEIRDSETAEIAIHAAQTGHLVLASVHTNSACETIARLLHLGLPAYQVADSLRLIIAQRLVRPLCLSCRKPQQNQQHAATASYAATESHANFNSYTNGDGCNDCDSGLMPRRGIFELLNCTPAIREHIYRYQTAIGLQTEAAKYGFTTLQQNANSLIKKGIISQAEAKRVISN